MAFVLAEKSVEKELKNKIITSNFLKKQTLAFLFLTFSLTFLLNFVMWLNYDIISESIELLRLATRVQMIIPAFSAIILNLFVFKTKIYQRKSRILLYYFLVLSIIFVLIFVVWLVNPIDLTSIQLDSFENLGSILALSFLNLAGLVLIIGWIALVFFWNLKSGSRKELKADKLSFGRPRYYLLFTLFFVGYFLLSTVLNWVFGLGNPPNEPVELGALLLGLATIFLGPILSFPQLFGEEYGWRIFLQDNLSIQFSQFRAFFLVGLVWSLWHIPMIILEGPYSDNLVLGIIVYTIGAILMSIILGLAVFKSKSVWIAAYLHGIIGIQNFFTTYFYNPSDLIFSFGLGIYGLPILGLFSFFFLKSKALKEREK